jgi:uncharacterized protein (DUF2062 family)
MLFGRRVPEPVLDRLRVAVWPRRSWRRSVRYADLRLRRLGASRHAIALGLAIGVFAAFQPVVGFQMLFAGAAAWLLRASIGAALAGTFVGGPVTWPFMWLASYHLGSALTGGEQVVTMRELWLALAGIGAIAAPDMVASGAGRLVWQVIYPLALGALPLGLLAGAAIYAMVMRMMSPSRR